jgi:class 3 adenylate cyclase/pimeloyl-ACP methyl ester carboxylesterase
MQRATKYAKAGDLHIAYQVVGDGPIDLVFVPSWFSHVEMQWQEPAIARVLDRLASFSRLIVFDHRGGGLSDPVPLSDPPTLEERMDDVSAVLDAVGSGCAAILGATLGGPLAALFAATYPGRTSAIVLHNTAARYTQTDDYPYGATAEVFEVWSEELGKHWGRPGSVDWIVGDERLQAWLPTYMRSAMSPGAAAANYRRAAQVDIRDVLPSISVPTLVLHRRDNVLVPTAHGRYLAEHIPGARFVELPGSDSVWFIDDPVPMLDVVEEFITGMPPTAPPRDRVLATVLFTDIVRSTEIAAEVGDTRWRDTLEAHGTLAARQVERYQGKLIKTTGDGILATFDGPTRAIRCAAAVRDAARSLGLEIRAGLHTGEIELVGSDIAGIGVNIASRVSSLAGAGEVLVSSTVKDLVVGSRIAFEDRGTHTLKGVPGHWRVSLVVG